MWNMAVNNISYSTYLLSTKIEKGYTTKIIPFFFVQYTSDKETFFLGFNIKVIGNTIHTSVYEKRDDFGFPIVNFL